MSILAAGPSSKTTRFTALCRLHTKDYNDYCRLVLTRRARVKYAKTLSTHAVMIVTECAEMSDPSMLLPVEDRRWPDISFKAGNRWKCYLCIGHWLLNCLEASQREPRGLGFGCHVTTTDPGCTLGWSLRAKDATFALHRLLILDLSVVEWENRRCVCSTRFSGVVEIRGVCLGKKNAKSISAASVFCGPST